MSAMVRGGKAVAASNAYTVYLALALAAVAACAAYVAFMCFTQYETIFKIVGP